MLELNRSVIMFAMQCCCVRRRLSCPAVDNLLRTNAGLSPEGGTIPEANFYSDTNMLLNQPDIPAYAAGLPLGYTPAGAVWDYSNAGFAMATLAIR